MERTIVFPDRVLNYQYEIKDVKNINIRIRPDMSVYVSSNINTDFSQVEKVLMENKEYICKALDNYSEMHKYASVEREYINGESFRLLGKDLRLKVSVGDKNFVDTDGLYLFLCVKKDEYDVKKRLIEQWYQ